jgi:transposase
VEITAEQYKKIAHCLPRHRGNVSLSNLQALNAVLFVAENGCKWRALPKRFGNWHTIYTRLSRWARKGVLQRVFKQLQLAQVIRIKIEAISLDSTIVKVHPDAAGALKKTGHRRSENPVADGQLKFIWSPQIVEQR